MRVTALPNAVDADLDPVPAQVLRKVVGATNNHYRGKEARKSLSRIVSMPLSAQEHEIRAMS